MLKGYFLIYYRQIIKLINLYFILIKHFLKDILKLLSYNINLNLIYKNLINI